MVWECSFTLTEMKDYISKVSGRMDSSRKTDSGQEEQPEEMDSAMKLGEGVEQGEELQESSDEST